MKKFWIVYGNNDTGTITRFARFDSQDTSEATARLMAADNRNCAYFILETVAVAHIPAPDIVITRL